MPGLMPPPHFCLGCFPTQNNILPPFSLPDLPSEASSGPVSSKMSFLITHGVSQMVPCLGAIAMLSYFVV